jgi:hypothetical protein
MKAMLVFMGILCPTLAWANPTANHYRCVGENTAATVYLRPGSLAPVMSVINLGLGGSETHEETLDNVVADHGAMGLLIEGRFAAIADAKLTFTLIVPAVVIKDHDVKGVEGMLVRSFAGTMPPPEHMIIPGPVQDNEFRPVTCVASIVR